MVLKYVGLGAYSLACFCVFFYVGLMTKKYRIFKNKAALTALFGSNLLVSGFAFKMSIFGTTMVNFAGLSAMYFGIKMRCIGLTGGIATGKSSVSRILKEQGFKVVDADQISHDLRKFNRAYQRAVVQEFGEEVFDPVKKEINSVVLGQIVFADREKRRRLESLSRWRIFLEMVRQIIDYRVFKGEKNVILDAPTLFESGFLEHLCHPIIVVYIDDEDEQLKRLRDRNQHLTEEQAIQRMNAQFPVKTKLAKS
jgi:dephospho-CoA kinase